MYLGVLCERIINHTNRVWTNEQIMSVINSRYAELVLQHPIEIGVLSAQVWIPNEIALAFEDDVRFGKI
jgi:hypothetical protein